MIKLGFKTATINTSERLGCELHRVSVPLHAFGGADKLGRLEGGISSARSVRLWWHLQVSFWLTSFPRADPVKHRELWQRPTWRFLLPCPCGKRKGTLQWRPRWTTGGKSCGTVGTSYEQDPLEFLTLRLVCIEPPAIHRLQFRFSWPALVLSGRSSRVAAQVRRSLDMPVRLSNVGAAVCSVLSLFSVYFGRWSGDFHTP